MGKELVLEGNLAREDFRKLYKKCKDVRLRERYHAMYLSFDYEWKEIAGILDIDYGTVLEWAKAYNKEGLPGLERDKPTGRPAQLSKEQLSVLKCAVLTTPRMLGMKFSSWTCKSIGKWARKSFGAALSAERIRQILHELGFVLLKRHTGMSLLTRRREDVSWAR